MQAKILVAALYGFSLTQPSYSEGTDSQFHAGQHINKVWQSVGNGAAAADNVSSSYTSKSPFAGQSGELHDPPFSDYHASPATLSDPIGPSPSLGSWVVGNGGDSLRIMMARTREFASQMVTKVSDAMLAKGDADVREFFKKYRSDLAADILASRHIWYSEPQSSCAWTTLGDIDDHKARPIEFSYPTCRQTLSRFGEAAALLIHESSHHFGTDEDFADRLALAVVSAWRAGNLEWQPMSQDAAPSARSLHSAVSTGDKVIIFGGQRDDQPLNDGGIYVIDQDQWLDLPSEGAPYRYNHEAIFTGSEMIVWGGYTRNGIRVNWEHNGAIYNIAEETWTPLKAPYDFEEVSDFHIDTTRAQRIVWTGQEVIIFGGINKKSGYGLGFAYNPRTRSWRSLVSEDSPQRLGGHTLTFSGSKVLVWGGFTGLDSMDRSLTSEGKILDLKTGQWQSMADLNVPAARYNHTATWTGHQLVVFNGFTEGRLSGALLHSSGGVYDLKTDSWEKVSSQMVTERQGHSAVWNGKEVLFMGGKSRYLQTYYSHVEAFDPEQQTFRATSGKAAPSWRANHTATWTGAAMIIWGGGRGRYNTVNTGKLFFP